MNAEEDGASLSAPLLPQKKKIGVRNTFVVRRQSSIVVETPRANIPKSVTPIGTTPIAGTKQIESNEDTPQQKAQKSDSKDQQVQENKRSDQRRKSSHFGRVSNHFYIVEKEYDPFQSPPDLDLARKHQQASRVGEPTESQKLDKENYCPCCYSIIEKEQISISCDEKDLAFLGVGHAQLFLLNKFFGILILIIFTFGGSLYLLVKNQMECTNNCLKIMGIAVMANKDVDIELMNPYLQTLVAMIIIAGVLYVKKKLSKRITRFKEGTFSPCEYTIMVQNIPLEARKEELKRHFEKLTNRRIVSISMAYDIAKYTQSIEQKSIDIKSYNTIKLSIKKLRKQLEEQGLSEKKIASLNKSIASLENQNNLLAEEMKHGDELIERFESDCQAEKDPSKFIGTAFITFNDTIPVNTIVEEWGYTYTNILKFILFRWVPPPFIEYRDKLLVIRNAPAPADVIWENLRFSLARNVINNTLMLILSMVILYISFRIQFLVMEYVYPFKKQSYEEHSFLLMIRGSLLSICVVIVNLSLRNTVFFFTKLQRFDHHTKLLNAYINKYIFLYFFNSAFMPYLVHVYLDTDNINIELLVWDIHFIILATSISTPLSKLFDPVMFFKIFKRWHIKSFLPEDCPYTQKEVNHWFEGHPLEIADSYAYMARVLFLGAWYAQVAPLGIIFSMIGLVCNHFIDKYSLLRIHNTPEQITEEVYSKVIFFLDLLPFIYLCGGIEYTQKSIISTNVFQIIFNFMNQSVAIVGLFLSLLAFIFHHKRKMNLKSAKKQNKPYHEVRTLFHTEYDRCNPVTQLKASNDYIKFLYDSKSLFLSGNKEQEMVPIQNNLNKSNGIRKKEETHEIDRCVESESHSSKSKVSSSKSDISIQKQKKIDQEKDIERQDSIIAAKGTLVQESLSFGNSLTFSTAFQNIQSSQDLKLSLENKFEIKRVESETINDDELINRILKKQELSSQKIS